MSTAPQKRLTHVVCIDFAIEVLRRSKTLTIWCTHKKSKHEVNFIVVVFVPFCILIIVRLGEKNFVLD